MKFIELFNKKRVDWGGKTVYELNEGKIDNHPVAKVLFFLPIAVVVSGLMIILTVWGLPSAMGVVKNGINRVFPAQENLKAAAPEMLFSDVPPNSKYFDSLAYLKKTGIITGFNDGSFMPEGKLSRAELVKTIVKARKEFPLALNYNNCFSDVKAEWFAPYVCLAKEKGWVDGYKGGAFQPGMQLSKAESLKMIMAGFDVKDPVGPQNPTVRMKMFDDVDGSSWYFKYVKLALQRGILEESPLQDLYKPNDPATRGQTSQIIYRMLQS